MSAADGFDIKLLSANTGISEGKIKMLLQRHLELQQIPYSFKAGRNRVFLPAMLVWLRQYEGILPAGADTLLSDNSPLPESNSSAKVHLNGAQLREIRLMVKDHVIAAEQAQALIGLREARPAIPAPINPIDKLNKDEAAALRIAMNILAKRERKQIEDQTQGNLGL